MSLICVCKDGLCVHCVCKGLWLHERRVCGFCSVYEPLNHLHQHFKHAKQTDGEMEADGERRHFKCHFKCHFYCVYSFP